MLSRPPAPQAAWSTPSANFLKLWTAAAGSSVGDGVRLVAFPLLAATVTRDPVLLAGVFVAAELPWLLFGLLSGALVDRLDRRRVMWTMDLGRMAVVLGLAAALSAGAQRQVVLGAVYGAAFLLGAAETLFASATPAILPQIVPREDLPARNGRLLMAVNAGRGVLGPPLGGLLFQAGALLPLLADAASFGFSAALLAWLRGRFRVPEAGAPRAGLLSEVGAGLRWTWDHRAIRALILVIAAVNLLAAATAAVLVLYALEVLRIGSGGYALVLAAGAAGVMAGSLSAGPVGRRLGVSRALVASMPLGAVSSAVIALAGPPVLSCAAFVAWGASAGVFNVLAVSLVQTWSPDALLGRVSSVCRLAAWATSPAGSLLGGLCADVIGPRGPFLLYAVGAAALTAVAAVAFAAAGVEPARAAASGGAEP